MPSGLATVAVLEPQHGGELRVVDFDGRLGAVDDCADQDALLALVERAPPVVVSVLGAMVWLRAGGAG